jgi:hypothetical protein
VLAHDNVVNSLSFFRKTMIFCGNAAETSNGIALGLPAIMRNALNTGFALSYATNSHNMLHRINVTIVAANVTVARDSACK